jgi:hypothetical protein
VQTKLVLALGQRELRSQLHVDHHPNAAVQLKEGQVLFDQSGSRIVDLSEVRRILLVNGPELVASLSARVKFAAMSCFFDRADIFAQQRELVSKRFGTAGGRTRWFGRCILGGNSWTSEHTHTDKCEHHKRDFLHSIPAP